MTFGNAELYFRKLKKLADWKLLLFLVLFLDVKMAVKIPAIVLIYLLKFNFKFGFSRKSPRLPLFYLFAIAIAILNWVISRNYFNINYDIALVTGIGFWVLCILAMHQIKLFVDQNDADSIHRTIVAFFVINALLSFCDIAIIIFKTGYLNPYTYQGEYQKYFIGTGDYIRGLTFDTSTTNAILNAFGCIYFLTRRTAVMLFVCMAVMLLTASNFTNIVLLFCFAVLFIFKSTRDQKSLIAICIMFLVIFMVKVSPQNSMYVHEVLKNTVNQNAQSKWTPLKPNIPVTLMPDNLLSASQRKQKIAQHYIDSSYVAHHQGKRTVIAPSTITKGQPPLCQMVLTSMQKTDSGQRAQSIVKLRADSSQVLEQPVQQIAVASAQKQDGAQVGKNILKHNYLGTRPARRKAIAAAKQKPAPAAVAVVGRPAEPIKMTESGRIFIPKPDINAMPYQHIADTNDYQKHLLGFIGKHKPDLPLSSQDNYQANLPGKAITLQQTMHFLKQHPFKMIMGDGMGNFSSKLAFRVSGLGFAGGYPKKYIYLDPDFLSNHLDVYLNYFSKKTDLHSLGNSPNSVYDQLLAEYGLLGVIAFFGWYIGYFLKHYKKLTYGLPLLMMAMAVLFIEYWFEQLSILVFLELLLLLDIKENSLKTSIINEY